MNKLAIFSVPKAFEGHTGIIQSNAIRSWRRISDDVEVLLIGDDPGVKEFANQEQLAHRPEIERNDRGTPLMNSVFEIAHQNCKSEYMMFINCDIMLTSKVVSFLRRLDELDLDEFLAIGMRTDFDQFEEIEFKSNWESEIERKAKTEGEYASILCKDYFIFRSSQYQDIPAFSIGRGNYDSWLVSKAAQDGLPIIDATHDIFAGHQNHDYEHVGGRMKAYLSGEEARNNIRLAEGSHYIRGSLATHRIDQQGRLKRVNRVPLWTLVRDSPRMLKQLFSFVMPKRNYSHSKAA